MGDRLELATSLDKLGILMSIVATRTRDRYRDGWAAWRELCDGVQIPPPIGSV